MDMTITATFKTDDTTLRHHNGERVTVVGELAADDRPGIMHLIHFPDGSDADAFNDELSEWRLSA
jgi:hypothetical protein